MAGADAAAAVVADVPVNLQHTVLQLGRAHGADLNHAAFLAAVALVLVQAGDALADNPQVVQVRLDAVIGAAAHGDFELVGQPHATVALIEALMDLLAQTEGIQQAVLAGGALAGHHGAHQGAGAACSQALLGDIGPEVLDLVVGDALDLDGQAGGKGDNAVAELLGSLSDAPLLGSGDLAVDRDDAAGEIVRALVAQKTKRLHALLIRRADG